MTYNKYMTHLKSNVDENFNTYSTNQHTILKYPFTMIEMKQIKLTNNMNYSRNI